MVYAGKLIPQWLLLLEEAEMERHGFILGFRGEENMKKTAVAFSV